MEDCVDVCIYIEGRSLIFDKTQKTLDLKGPFAVWRIKGDASHYSINIIT